MKMKSYTFTVLLSLALIASSCSKGGSPVSPMIPCSHQHLVPVYPEQFQSQARTLTWEPFKSEFKVPIIM